MIQEILVFAIFIAAISYVGYLLWKSINTDKDCGTGCNCDPGDVKKMRKQMIRNHSEK